MPAATKLLMMLKTPKKITISPADLKKIPERATFWILSELKLRSESTGSVPSANADIVSAPAQKLPVLSAYICMDWVNPQGKKNVAAPNTNGVRVWLTLLNSCT